MLLANEFLIHEFCRIFFRTNLLSHTFNTNSSFFSEIPKKALLQKISNLRRDRQQQLQSTRTSTSLDHSANQLNGLLSNNSNASESDLAVINKRQLILNTIEDLKRNLEDQSIELIGLNDDEE